MSEWKDALCDYMIDNQPENYDSLSKEEKAIIDAKLLKDFTEDCDRAEALYDMGRE
jgi:hypothetical protein